MEAHVIVSSHKKARNKRKNIFTEKPSLKEKRREKPYHSQVTYLCRTWRNRCYNSLLYYYYWFAFSITIIIIIIILLLQTTHKSDYADFHDDHAPCTVPSTLHIESESKVPIISQQVGTMMHDLWVQKGLT